MIENYQIPTLRKSNGAKIISKIKGMILFCALMLVAPIVDATAQQTFTLGTGAINSTSVGVTPYSTSNTQSRSQFLYLAEELLNAGAASGNIISFDMKITELALPAVLKPENIQVKMGATVNVLFGDELVPNLPLYYSATMLPINQLGWYTITLNTPYEWNGEKNIIIEICRSNSFNGTSFGVESTLFNQTDFRSVGLVANTATVAGCDLTGQTEMIQSLQRTRPNIRFTMTNPCSGNPSSAGTTVVSENASCNGSPFTLTVANGAIESGLAYEWQSAPSENGPWTPINGAVNTTYTTPQSVSTWYRRGTLCIDSGEGLYSTAIQVSGAGCYCTVGSLNENAIGITNVTFAEINNTSNSLNAFTNYTAVSTDVSRGSTYPLSVKVNTTGGSNYTVAWIDWDNNNTFDTSEQILLGTVTGGANVNSGIIASVTVPANATLGNTVMRVRTKQSSDNDFPMACGLVPNGESEDYTINIMPSLNTDDFIASANSVIAYSDANGVQVQSRIANIASIAIYDISGRLIAKNDKINQQATHISLSMKGQVIIVKVTTTDDIVINKKVILN